jgi:hypothetical protein
MSHRTGYHVYAHGLKSWHRTLAGARRRARREQRWCSNVQIIEVATGDLLSGRPE